MNEEYYGTFASYGQGDGQFMWPSSIVISDSDKIYVSDEYSHKISIMTLEGEFISSFGQLGNEDGEFDGPNGLIFDNKNQLYVVDHRNGRIQVFDESGNFIRKFSSQGNNEGQLNLPWGITYTSNDRLYVSDWGNHRIQEFSTDGEFIRSFGSKGDEEQNILHPSSCAVDDLGNIYVCEALCEAAISPLRISHTISNQRISVLVTAIRDVLSAAISAGGSSIQDFRKTDGSLGYFQHKWGIYGREGKPCLKIGCKGKVRRIKQAGRSTFYCAKHQR